jgi:hypothetical protein
VLGCFALGFCIASLSGHLHKASAHHSGPSGAASESGQTTSIGKQAQAANAIAQNPASSQAGSNTKSDTKSSDQKEIAQGQAVAANHPQPVVQKSEAPTTDVKTRETSANNVRENVAQNIVSKDQGKTAAVKPTQLVAANKKENSVAAPMAQPTPAVTREKIVTAHDKPSLANPDRQPSAQTVASARPTTTPASAKTTQTAGVQRSNPVFYVDLGPPQDPDSPKPAHADTDNGPAVTYRNGQLTIHAKDVTLTSLLQMVALKTRARIDVPPGDAGEHIAVHAGPGPVDDVLAQLLKGSPFNFVIVHSPQRPSELQEVLLTMRGPSEPASLAPEVQAEAAPKQGLPKELLEKLFSRKRADFPPSTDETPPPPPPSDQAPANGTASPEAVEQLMKDKANEIRQNADQQ